MQFYNPEEIITYEITNEKGKEFPIVKKDMVGTKYLSGFASEFNLVFTVRILPHVRFDIGI
jgi:hypothetical protein